MGTTYAIADLHGRLDLLEAALAEIEKREPGTVVFTGDYVDRGPESAQIIFRLMAGPPQGWKWICLQGNHESMMIETLTSPLDPNWWVGNGGGQTLISYGHPPQGPYDRTIVPDDHIAWLTGLPLLHVDRHRVFVHAGVDPTIPLDQQSEQDMQWMLYPEPEHFAGGHGDLHVVHGHHQFAHGPILTAGRTDLDTFAWATGRLVVGVFDDDLAGGPVDLIEILRAPHKAFASEFAALSRPLEESEG